LLLDDGVGGDDGVYDDDDDDDTLEGCVGLASNRVFGSFPISINSPQFSAILHL